MLSCSAELLRWYLTRSIQLSYHMLKTIPVKVKYNTDIFNFVIKHQSKAIYVQQCIGRSQECAFQDALKLPVSCIYFIQVLYFCITTTPSPCSWTYFNMPLSFIITLRGLNTICEQWMLSKLYPLATVTGSSASQTRNSESPIDS